MTSTLVRAGECLRSAGVRGFLVGTAALWLRGYLVPDPPDADFLCERAPDFGLDPAVPRIERPPSVEGGSTCALFDLGFGDATLKIDFIAALGNARLLRFLSMDFEWIRGVPCASAACAIELKRSIGRYKDREWLRLWDAGAFDPVHGLRRWSLSDEQFFALVRRGASS